MTWAHGRMTNIPCRSHILSNIWPTLAWLATVAVAVVAYMGLYEAHALPEGWISISPSRTAVFFLNSTNVVIISTLLVFRTNNSYKRWDEARKAMVS